jgi:hypothetical protein
MPHDTSCIPRELRKGSNNSEAIAIAAFGAAKRLFAALAEVNQI